MSHNMNTEDLNIASHRRKNILTGEWVLVSPHRLIRPWQGEVAEIATEKLPIYDPDCYLCPCNKRANGEVNPDYKSTFVFTNDFSALQKNISVKSDNKNDLLVAKTETGICRVVNFSPRHDLTLAEMQVPEIEKVIGAWQVEFANLGSDPKINYVQIFENKGALMGNSNPHPHCQIWAQHTIPNEPKKELDSFRKYYSSTRKSILADYVKLELKQKERIVVENSSFVVLVPFWAVWPFETILIPKRKISTILQLTEKEKKDFASALKIILVKYDNLFKTSFPYSAGLHQAPTDGNKHPEWHFHMHFYPPLLRSASIKKFMVGYELMAEPQRDLTPEISAKMLRDKSSKHYKESKKTTS